jgi:hypothetical protein
MVALHSAYDVVDRFLPGTSRLIVDYVAEALLDLTDCCLREGVAPELDAGLVIKEVREFNTSDELKERIVRLLDQTEFKCRWALPEFIYNPQLAGFALDEPFKAAPPELPDQDTWEVVPQFTAKGAARFADFLARIGAGDVTSETREALELSCLGTLESKLNGLDCGPLTWEFKDAVFEAVRDDLATETVDPALIPDEPILIPND